MYKKILTTIALAASFLACNKVENEIVTPASEGKALEVNVTIGAPATKLAYTEAAEGSYKATFDNNDVLWLYFISQADTVVGNVCKMPIDGKSISFDGKTAAFRCPSVTIPEGAVKVVTYLANTSCATNFDGGNEIIADYSAQASSTVALNNQIVTGSASVADLKSKDAATYTTSIALGYKTSLLKFSLALPEGVTVESGAALTLNMDGKKIHNKLHLVAGELGAKSDFGGINATASCADGKTVTATAAVWAADDLSSILSVVVGEETYSVEFKPSASVAAGKVYTIERTLAMAPKPTSVWTGDEAGSADFKYSGGEDLTNDWLSCKSGKVSWSANTTGAPRSAKLTFKNGATFELCQVEAKDLAGNYTFYNYSFKSAGVSTTTAGANRKHETAVQIKAVENPQTVNGHVHNIDIVGLYLDFALPASFEVVDGVPSVYTYLSLDYQTLNNGAEVACIPELTNTAAYGTGYFAPVSFGVDNCNYAWIAWGVDDLFGTSKFTVGTGEQRFVSENRYCCGFSFNLKGYSEGGYTTIYQFNYNNSWTYTGTAGAYFCKK
jgi:hypothetical protein